MKRYFCLAFTVLFCMMVAPQPMKAESAASYCVIDSVTGRVLYEKDAYTKRGMASTTKIMTALVALERANPDDIATVSYNASRTEGSSLYLKAGEKMRISDLVYGLMLNSGNDAAVVLAEHIGGDVGTFAGMMNEMAREIGANATHFKNPNGLHDDDHYTTAYDLALITRRAMQNETFRKIAATKKYTAETVDSKRKIYLSNHNKLLNSLDGCDGVKTGFTKKTGRCLVSSVTRDGWQAICVTLNAGDDWNDHTTLMNKAFSEHQNRRVITKGQFIKTVPVSGGMSDCIGAVADAEVSIPAKENEKFDFEVVYHIDTSVAAPITQGQPIGNIELILNGKTFATVGLLSDSSVEMTKRASYFDKLRIVLRCFI